MTEVSIECAIQNLEDFIIHFNDIIRIKEKNNGEKYTGLDEVQAKKDIEIFIMAIKALKQYGALQEIRQEITSRMPKVTDNDFEDGMKHFGEEVLYIIDKHIREMEK